MKASAMIVRNDEATLICQITKRAADFDKNVNRIRLALCLCAVHINEHTLDLEGLLRARLVDFWHDVDGILRHTNLDSGTLRGFRPMHVKGGAEEASAPKARNLRCLRCQHEWISNDVLTAMPVCPRCRGREVLASSPFPGRPTPDHYGVGGPA